MKKIYLSVLIVAVISITIITIVHAHGGAIESIYPRDSEYNGEEANEVYFDMDDMHEEMIEHLRDSEFADEMNEMHEYSAQYFLNERYAGPGRPGRYMGSRTLGGCNN